VTKIGDDAFTDSGLASITCFAATPPTIANRTFYRVSKSIPVYVPCASVEAYRAANYWKAFSNIQCATSGINSISAEKNFMIYPNPVKDELFIQSKQPVEKIEIIDLSGRTVETLRATSLQNGAQSINVSSLPASVYLVKIGAEIRKFVKE
jgi:hypothetical protein